MTKHVNTKNTVIFHSIYSTLLDIFRKLTVNLIDNYVANEFHSKNTGKSTVKTLISMYFNIDFYCTFLWKIH